MGSKTSSQQNQQSSTVADPQAYADYSKTISRAQNVSRTPYTAYSGQLTAPVNAQETTATNAMNGLGATASGYFGSAAQQSGLGAAAVNPSAVDASAINQYMSPYQSDVINSTSALLNQQDQIQQQQQTSAAIGAGAFGGDRSGVAAAALARQQDLANNSTLAGLENQNYSQALSEANTQQSVGLGAAQANRAAVQQNAATLAGIGSAATTAGLGVANAQLGAGALQQQTTQAGDTANYGQFLQQEAYPFQTEQYLANIVGSLAPNYGSSTAGMTTTETSPLNSILGGAALAGGLAPSVSSLGTGLGNLGSSIGGLFSLSDRRTKENIRKCGALFDGQPIYSFNFKGSPHTELGLVAQEVEKKHPSAVAPGLGGLKHVDYEAATRAAADRGHFARGGRTPGLGPKYHTLSREEVANVENGGSARMVGLGWYTPAPRASGGAVGPYADSESYVGGGAGPYAGAAGYVPVSQGLGAARMLSSPLPSASQPTNPIPSFNQFSQASQGLGAIGGGLSKSVSGLGDAIQDYSQDAQDGYASGGVVAGLGARRGYDDGGVVSPDDLVFDPNAFGDPGAIQPGLGNAAAYQPGFTPPPSQGLAPAALPPAAPPQGLGQAVNDNAPVPVAPAPVTTPIVGYRQAGLGAASATPPQAGLGAPAPAPGLGGTTPPPADGSPMVGLGAASDGVAAINAASPPTGVGFGFNRSVNRTLGFEGGMKSADTNGTPSNYGINQAANPDVDVSKLTPDQARSIYKSRYWDAINGDKLPGPLAHVAFDTAVMAGPARANAMIAQSGGDPSKFMDLRDGYLNGLLQADPGKYGKYADAWASRSAALRGDIGAGGAPSSALSYTTGLGGPGSTQAGLGGTGLPPGYNAAPMQAGLGAADTSKARGLAGFLGFGAGNDGGLLGLSDDARQALISTGAAIMASPSKSPGIAIGEGIGKGLATNQAQQALNREADLARAKAANVGSEIQNRTATQGIERDRVKVAQQELAATLANYTSEAKYRDAEGKARLSEAATNVGRLNLERYNVIAGPDNSFIYFDKLNPGAGLLTPAQVAAASGGIAPTAATGPQSAPPAGGAAGGAPAQAGPGAAPAPAAQAAPAALDSSQFVKSGSPVLSLPHNYVPKGYYQTAMRAQTDPVMRDTLAKQTMSDVTEANERAQKAYSSTFYSDEMDKNAASLPNSGILVPGAAFPERLGLAKNWNAAVTALGMDGLQVDTSAAKAGEALVKDKTRLGAQLTQQLGSREAAAVFGSMMSAVPGGDNTRAGYKAISSSIRVLAQRDIDRNAFFQDRAGRYGNTLNAETEFNQLNPSMMYARQAQALARIPQQATDLLRANANDPRYRAAFERAYGAGLSRYFTGQLGQ